MINQLYILEYYATSWDLNCELLQQEILGVPVGLGLALVNYLHRKFASHVWGDP